MAELRPRSRSALPSGPAKPTPPSPTPSSPQQLASSTDAVLPLKQLSSLTKGSKVWIPTEEESDKKLPSEWIAAEVVDLNENDGKVVIKYLDDLKRKEEAVHVRQLLLRNAESQDQNDDLITLSELNPPCILHTLQQRYLHNKIYTFTGTILISVNPYRWFPDLYTKEMMLKYSNQQLGKLPPHVYAIAEAAYRSMLFDNKSQSILVSGESGAGKTETTKFILQFFAHVGKSASHLEEKVLQSTPILEAFGNSRTIWNDNSSRFGKFIKIEFDAAGNITGASIQTYLLEKSRIVRPPVHERNYHIFYRILAGLSESDRKDLCLKDASHYHYLAQSRCFEIEGVDEQEQFQKTIEAMDVVGLTREEQKNIFAVLAAVLNLGNIRFVGDDKASIENPGQVDIVAHLLGCKPKDLERALLTKELRTGSEVYTVYMDASKATNSRDTLAMLLYSRLFDWLVSKINQSLGRSDECVSFISILDIYGFECFEVNSFEQFCINYANEKLQQQFNHHIFKLEQEEYVREQIDWSYVQFKDNQECIDLIESRMGLLAILDEESKFPKATDESLLNKLVQSHARHINFKLPEFGEAAFSIVHYAGRVKYHTRGFLEKNRDYVVQEHANLLSRSVDRPLISALATFSTSSTSSSSLSNSGTLPPSSPRSEQRHVRSRSSVGVTPTGPSPGSPQGGLYGPSASPRGKDSSQTSTFAFLSVVAQFKDSLNALMETISQTEPHYIRCIKPNDEKKPKLFGRKKALHQLRSGGVLEAVRIASAGFPTRLPLEQFFSRYRMLMPIASSSSSVPLKEILSTPSRMKSICGKLFQELGFGPDRLQFGVSKLFLRAGVISQLEVLRLNRMHSAATLIQKRYRGVVLRKSYLKYRAATTCLQSALRFRRDRAEARRRRETRAAIRLQTSFRRFFTQKKFRETIRKVLQLQKMARAVLARKRLLELRKHRLATQIQSAMRGWRERSAFQRFRDAVVLVQSSFRVRRAKRELRRLRIEARSVDEVRKQRDTLQAQLMKAHEELAVTKEQLRKQSTSVVDSKELDSLRVSLKETQDAKKQAESKVNEAVDRELAVRKSFEDRIAQLEQELQEEKVARKADQSAHETQIQKMEAEISRKSVQQLQSQSDQTASSLRAENEQLHSQLSKSEQIVSALRSEMEAKTLSLEKTVGELMKEKQSDESLKQQLSAELANAKQKIAEVEAERNTAIAENKTLIEEKNGLTANLSKVQEEKKELSVRISALEQHQKPEEKNASSAEEITFFRARDTARAPPPALIVQQQQSVVSSPVKQVSDTPSAASELQLRISELQKENAQLRDEAAERAMTNDDISELIAEKTNLVAEVSKLRKRIIELEGEISQRNSTSGVTMSSASARSSVQPLVTQSSHAISSTELPTVSPTISATSSVTNMTSSTVTTNLTTAELEQRVREQLRSEYESEIKDLKAELYDAMRTRERSQSARPTNDSKNSSVAVSNSRGVADFSSSFSSASSGGSVIVSSSFATSASYNSSELFAELAKRDAALTVAYEQNTLKTKQIESLQIALQQQKTEAQQLSSQIFLISEKLKSLSAGGAPPQLSKLQQELVEQKSQVGLISRENSELRREKNLLQWEAEVRLKELGKELAKLRTSVLLSNRNADALLREDCAKLQELLFRSTAMCVKLSLEAIKKLTLRTQTPIAQLYETACAEGVHYAEYERWLNKMLMG